MENKVCRFCKRCIFIEKGKCIKSVECSGNSEFIMDQLPDTTVKKDSISLTEILWRELKKHHKEYCERLSLDPNEYWGKYQIHLIKESQGKS